MPAKKISELTKVTSVDDDDLLLVETPNGTRAVKKNDLIIEIKNQVNGIVVPTKLSDLTDDATHRLTTDTEKSSWNAKQTKIVSGSITLASGSWSGSGDIYNQTVTISGGTAKSKIDLQPNTTVISQMLSDGTSAMYIENNNGTFKAYAIGAKPTVNLSIQFTRTEVG